MNPEEVSALIKSSGLVLKKGDTLVISPAVQVSKELLKKLGDDLQPVFAENGNKLVILPPGLRIEKLTPDDIKKVLSPLA